MKMKWRPSLIPSKFRARTARGRAALVACGILLMAGGVAVLATGQGPSIQTIPAFARFPDPSGAFADVNTAGDTDATINAFFQDLGTNGRRCVSCHQPSDAWTVTPPHIQERFESTAGLDPIFRPNDGSGCPTQDVSTVEARRNAYSLLLSKGLIRIEINVPTNAEFTVLNSVNPYGCTSTTAISAYRRPLPSTNLPFLSTVMWDGRETFKDVNGKFQPIGFD